MYILISICLIQKYSVHKKNRENNILYYYVYVTKLNQNTSERCVFYTIAARYTHLTIATTK